MTDELIIRKHRHDRVLRQRHERRRRFWYRITSGVACLIFAVLGLALLTLTGAFWRDAYQEYADPLYPPMDALDWWWIAMEAWAGVALGWCGVLALSIAVTAGRNAR